MKYAYHKDFRLLAYLKLPVVPSLIYGAEAALGGAFKLNRSHGDIKITKLKIPARDSVKLSAILIEPKGIEDNAPLLVYLHGGGYVFRVSPHQVVLCQRYASACNCKVLIVDYRVAPRHKYPTAVNDCFDTYLYALKNAELFGVDKNRIAVGGDSAGGCLAASMCLMARDKGVKMPVYQLLVYPATDKRMNTESNKLYTDTPMWNSKQSEKMYKLYLGEDVGDNYIYASPNECEQLAGLPDAYVETAEFDCLHDEGVIYAQRLSEAGSDVTLYETKETVHGYDFILGSAITKQSVRHRTDALNKAFKK